MCSVLQMTTTTSIPPTPPHWPGALLPLLTTRAAMQALVSRPGTWVDPVAPGSDLSVHAQAAYDSFKQTARYGIASVPIATRDATAWCNLGVAVFMGWRERSPDGDDAFWRRVRALAPLAPDGPHVISTSAGTAGDADDTVVARDLLDPDAADLWRFGTPALRERADGDALVDEDADASDDAAAGELDEDREDGPRWGPLPQTARVQAAPTRVSRYAAVAVHARLYGRAGDLPCICAPTASPASSATSAPAPATTAPSSLCDACVGGRRSLELASACMRLACAASVRSVEDAVWSFEADVVRHNSAWISALLAMDASPPPQSRPAWALFAPSVRNHLARASDLGRDLADCVVGARPLVCFQLPAPAPLPRRNASRAPSWLAHMARACATADANKVRGASISRLVHASDDGCLPAMVLLAYATMFDIDYADHDRAARSLAGTRSVLEGAHRQGFPVPAHVWLRLRVHELAHAYVDRVASDDADDSYLVAEMEREAAHDRVRSAPDHVPEQLAAMIGTMDPDLQTAPLPVRLVLIRLAAHRWSAPALRPDLGFLSVECDVTAARLAAVALCALPRARIRLLALHQACDVEAKHSRVAGPASAVHLDVVRMLNAAASMPLLENLSACGHGSAIRNCTALASPLPGAFPALLGVTVTLTHLGVVPRSACDASIHVVAPSHKRRRPADGSPVAADGDPDQPWDWLVAPPPAPMSRCERLTLHRVEDDVWPALARGLSSNQSLTDIQLPLWECTDETVLDSIALALAAHPTLQSLEAGACEVRNRDCSAALCTLLRTTSLVEVSIATSRIDTGASPAASTPATHTSPTSGRASAEPVARASTGRDAASHLGLVAAPAACTAPTAGLRTLTITDLSDGDIESAGGLAGSMPRVEHLTLQTAMSAATLAWTGTLRSLTLLEIRRTLAEPSVDALLNALRACPRLSTLWLATVSATTAQLRAAVALPAVEQVVVSTRVSTPPWLELLDPRRRADRVSFGALRLGLERQSRVALWLMVPAETVTTTTTATGTALAIVQRNMRQVLRECCLSARACTELQIVRARHWATASLAIAAWRAAPPKLVHGCTALIAGIVTDADPGPWLTDEASQRGGNAADANPREFVINATRLDVDALFATRFALAHMPKRAPPPS